MSQGSSLSKAGRLPLGTTRRLANLAWRFQTNPGVILDNGKTTDPPIDLRARGGSHQRLRCRNLASPGESEDRGKSPWIGIFHHSVNGLHDLFPIWF
jgi:hypothetical protein